MIRDVLKKYSWEVLVALAWLSFFAGIAWLKADASYEEAKAASSVANKAAVDVALMKKDIEHIRTVVDRLYAERNRR